MLTKADWSSGLQRGRAQLSAEFSLSLDVTSHSDRLQRGRAQLSAELQFSRLGSLLAHAASTGPRSIERGVLVVFLMPRPKIWLQRGRAQLSAELELTPATLKAARQLQRGRAQLSAEFGEATAVYGASGYASTGPRSIERGVKHGKRTNNLTTLELQRGRAQLSAELALSSCPQRTGLARAGCEHSGINLALGQGLRREVVSKRLPGRELCYASAWRFFPATEPLA